MPRLVSAVQQQLFTVQETAIRTRRSVSSVWRDIKAKRYDVVYIGGSTRVTGDSIDAMIAGEAAPKTAKKNPNPNVKPKVDAA